MKGHLQIDLSEFHKFNKLMERASTVKGMLDVLIDTVSRMVPEVDMAIAYLYDSNRKVLRLGAARGVLTPSLGKIAFRPGESLTGKVFVTKQPVFCSTRREVVNMMSNISSENMKWYEEGTERREVRSSLNIPLMDHNRCLGTFTLNRDHTELPFSQDDIRILNTLTDQAARMIGYIQIAESLEDSHIKAKFRDVLISGGGIDGVTKLLERKLGNPFSISSCENEPDYSVPVAANRTTLGYLVSQKLLSEFSQLELRTIHHAADVAAIELRRIFDDYENSLSVRSECFKGALNGGNQEELLEYIDAEKDTPLHCFVFSAVNHSTDLARELDRQVTKHFPGASLFHHDAYYVILSPAQSRSEEFARLLYDTYGWVTGTGAARPITEIDLSFNEAVIASGHSATRLVEYRTLGYRRLWYSLNDQVKTAFIHDHIGPLLTMSPEYLKTLGALIKNGRAHKSTAASELYIHVNTLYQRLRKIEQTLGISLDDEHHWVNIVIAYGMYVESDI